VSTEEPDVLDPLEVTVDVACPPADAFAVWTERIDLWWPKGHSVGGDTDVVVVLEPGVGGRIYERTRDGREIDWGEVTRWDPPVHLAYLWHIRRDRRDATDVAIRFVDRGDGTTRVEIRHSGWERLGAGGAAWRDANRGGWAGLLPHYVELVAARAADPTPTQEGS
jgi:uncharacterized protein YndB with AHSA1/START domain